jgi:hypothetical protein
MNEPFDRSKMPIRKFHLHDRPKRERPSPEECLGMMWDLADTAWAFMGHSDGDAEADVQRRIVRVVRRPG